MGICNRFDVHRMYRNLRVSLNAIVIVISNISLAHFSDAKLFVHCRMCLHFIVLHFYCWLYSHTLLKEWFTITKYSKRYRASNQNASKCKNKNTKSITKVSIGKIAFHNEIKRMSICLLQMMLEVMTTQNAYTTIQ